MRIKLTWIQEWAFVLHHFAQQELAGAKSPRKQEKGKKGAEGHARGERRRGNRRRQGEGREAEIIS